MELAERKGQWSQLHPRLGTLSASLADLPEIYTITVDSLSTNTVWTGAMVAIC